jgi:glycosyltransferase involved in cell wall biosynthesis
MRIVTDIEDLDREAPADVGVFVYGERSTPSRWLRLAKIYWRSWRCDYAVLHFDPPSALLLGLLLWATPFRHCRLVTLDLFVDENQWAGRRMRASLYRFLLRRIHLFLVFVRDTSRHQELFGLPADRFRYIPYKINAYPLIRQTTPADDGYIFCGGRSRRDFATFFAAVEPIGYPVKLIAGPESVLRQNGSSLNGLSIPTNVDVLSGDSSVEFFVKTMARGRLVVIPILKNVLTQAGIAVYMMGMALRKCVIVSSGPGVSDVLEDQAIVVPAGDPEALRRAVVSAWENPELRRAVAARGFAYATSLGGTDALRRSILKEVLACGTAKSAD